VRTLAIAMALALGGCASKSSAYTRTDGAPVDPLPSPYGVVERARKEKTLIDACMARNGYIQAQQ